MTLRRTRIKICGITRAADALTAQQAGCDAVGFVFWPGSPRCISIDDAAIIVRQLSPMMATIGVFVSPTPDDVLDTCRRAGLNGAQLCGGLSDGDWASVAGEIKLIRAIGIGGTHGFSTSAVRGFSDVLVDHHSDERYGGTGQTFDWSRLDNIGDSLRIWLAGGLHSDNVGEAIARVRPFAVDVSTGVEDRPGLKSQRKILQFVSAVRVADGEMMDD